AIRGTEFDAQALPASGPEGPRLLALVRKGSVELGRRGGTAVKLDAGHAGLADAVRATSAPASGRSALDALLAPRVTLTAPGGPVPSGRALELQAELAANDGGPVT